MIVFRLHHLQSELLGVTLTFVSTYQILAFGIDIGVTVIYCGRYAVLHHAFHNGGGAGCAAGMQQHLRRPVGHRYLEFLFHVSVFLYNFVGTLIH